ncbi:branched-chain amino acid ABC transporter permease [Aeromicrobium sp. A1-2]|uniref:AzlC family ABC transporter permease n=1 Tax=Aeromicrobium sp. A1-2 TaxID=2107713 RepID=UPI000E524612|nr:AzlC family ABC transporter permease [Aeromicrobium sp. A1-2]AXT85211.1 branched-chain amino acid ABC transporter permease [Aeromicrobium sp. A1-2]
MTTDRSVVIDSLGVGLATGVYGVSFGTISTASGLSIMQTCALSLLVFTGASQFAFIGIIASGGNPITGALTAVLLGSRNMFYGLSLARLLDLGGRQRLASAHIVIDESTAMAASRPTRRQARLGFYWTGISIFILWNLTTFLGALAGQAIGQPETYGLDAAVGAAFLGLLWSRLTSWHARTVAVFGAAVALGLVPLTAAGLPIILGGGAAVVLGMVWRPRSRA